MVEQSRVKFLGEVKIDKEWRAGRAPMRLALGRAQSSSTTAMTTRLQSLADDRQRQHQIRRLSIIQSSLEKLDMNLYVLYQFADGSFIGNAATAATGAPIGKTEIDGFQEVITGAKINF